MKVSPLAPVAICIVHNTVFRHFPVFSLKKPMNSV